MKIAPPSADMLIKLALLGIGIGVAVYAVRRVTDAVQGAASAAWAPVESAASAAAQYVAEGTRYMWYGPPDAQDSYQELLERTRSEVSFTNNPNNVNPFDLIPPGYRMNQWGGLEPINTGGASGSW